MIALFKRQRVQRAERSVQEAAKEEARISAGSKLMGRIEGRGVMTQGRKQQIAWWAARVYDQAQMYADVADPKRTRTDRIANKLDAITALARKLHFDITGKLPAARQSKEVSA